MGEPQQMDTEAHDDGDAGRAGVAAGNAAALGVSAGASVEPPPSLLGRPRPSCAPVLGGCVGASVEPPPARVIGAVKPSGPPPAQAVQTIATQEASGPPPARAIGAVVPPQTLVLRRG